MCLHVTSPKPFCALNVWGRKRQWKYKNNSIIQRFSGSFSITVWLFLLIFLVVFWYNEAEGKTLCYPLSHKATLLNHALTGTQMLVPEKKFARYHWLLAALQYFATRPVFCFWKIIRKVANAQKNWSEDKDRTPQTHRDCKPYNVVDPYKNKYNLYSVLWNLELLFLLQYAEKAAERPPKFNFHWWFYITS